MADPQEEQELELEALSSIYSTDQFERIDSSGKDPCFRLVLRPSEDDECYVQLTLEIQYPTQYPLVPPIWRIHKSQGLDSMLLKELSTLVGENIQRLIGNPMAFDLAEAILEWLRVHNRPQVSMYQEMMDQNQKDESGGSPSPEIDGSPGLEEDEHFAGETFKGLEEKDLPPEADRVTAEAFNKWISEFRSEMINSGLWKSSLADDSVPSGRQLFQCAAYSADIAAADSGALAVEEAAELHWSNPNLFGESGSSDIDGLDDDCLSDD